MKKFYKAAAVSALSVCLAVSFAASGCGNMNGGKDDYDGNYAWETDGGEYDKNYTYGAVIEQPFVEVSKNAVSTVSIDRNTSSYTLMRRQINEGREVAADSVRLEEYINYFDYDYDYPSSGEAVSLSTKTFDCPWNTAHKLVSAGIRTAALEVENKMNNIVLLIDVSGSMYGEDRLDLIVEAFNQYSRTLTENDRLSIVTYASGVKKVLDGANGLLRSEIEKALNSLEAGGSTNGAGGLQTAYVMAEKNFIEGGNNRIYLATDGDFNVGISSEEGLKALISDWSAKGIYISVLGVGMNNTNDKTMQAIATNGNGGAYYLDGMSEAMKVLVKDKSGTQYVVAKDAKFKAEFSESVAKYRIIGYDTKIITVEDFDDEKKDAGEIGSGLTVTVLYEIEPILGLLTGELLMTATVNYKEVEDNGASKTVSKEALNIAASGLDKDAKFIACVAEYGLLLRKSKYKGNASFSALISRLDDLGESYFALDKYKAEFVTLVKKANNLYGVND